MGYRFIALHRPRVAGLRDAREPWFTEDDVRLLTELSAPIAEGLRRSMLHTSVAAARPGYGPGVVVFDEHGEPESISPAAEQWIERMVELPRPTDRGCCCTPPLSGGSAGRIAVIIQPATPNEVAPLVALAYGLSERECQVTRLCMVGQSTKEIAATLHASVGTTVRGAGRLDMASLVRVAALHNRDMYIRVDRAGVSLVDGNNFRAFAVEVVGEDVDLGGALEGVGEVAGEHVFLDVQAVKELAGDGATAEWEAEFDGMIEFARSKGWVDEAGRVRAHIERRDAAAG